MYRLDSLVNIDLQFIALVVADTVHIRLPWFSVLVPYFDIVLLILCISLHEGRWLVSELTEKFRFSVIRYQTGVYE